MEETNEETKNAKSTAIVVLNTRSIGGYKSVDEMLLNQEAQDLWGNKFAFLHISLPVLNEDDHSLNPLKFVQEVQNVIKRKRNSSTVYLNGMLLESVRKYRGPEATAEYIHSTLKNSSMGMSNMIGPLEKMALANQPVKGLYFMPVNLPLSLTVTITSYMDQLRVAVGTEKGLIDPIKFSACTQKAFNMIFNAAVIYFRTSGGGALCMLSESMWYEAIPVNGYFSESCSYGSALGIMGPKYVPELIILEFEDFKIFGAKRAACLLYKILLFGLGKIARLINAGKIDSSELITMKTLKDTGAIGKQIRDGVRLMGRGSEQKQWPIHPEVSRVT
ncbi:O-acyltransferase WSD1-like protein, partial [Tanacetum coccineum]